MMASEPKAKEQYIVSSSAARTNCNYIDNNDGGGGDDDVINHDVALHSFFEISIFNVNFGLELRILTPYRVGTIGTTLIFGLDSTINR